MDFIGLRVIPEQKLEGKEGYFAQISNFYSSRREGYFFKVKVRRTYDKKVCGLDLNQGDFGRLIKEYDAQDLGLGGLMGKIVIPIHEKGKKTLCGLVIPPK